MKSPAAKIPHLAHANEESAAKKNTTGTTRSPGIWKTQSSARRDTIRTARMASSTRPSSPPNSWNDCTALTACCLAAGASAATSAMPGTIRGMC